MWFDIVLILGFWGGSSREVYWFLCECNKCLSWNVWKGTPYHVPSNGNSLSSPSLPLLPFSPSLPLVPLSPSPPSPSPPSSSPSSPPSLSPSQLDKESITEGTFLLSFLIHSFNSLVSSSYYTKYFPFIVLSSINFLPLFYQEVELVRHEVQKLVSLGIWSNLQPVGHYLLLLLFWLMLLLGSTGGRAEVVPQTQEILERFDKEGETNGWGSFS